MRPESSVRIRSVVVDFVVLLVLINAISCLWGVLYAPATDNDEMARALACRFTW